VVDVTVASFEEMEPIYNGLARRARASLGVTGWGMQVMTLPPNWDGYPNHGHDAHRRAHSTRHHGQSWVARYPCRPPTPEYRMEATASDNSVLVAAQAGDEQAFVQLTAPHRQPLHRHCYRILGSLHDADDALQETMLRAWRGIDRFQPRAQLRSWLYRIATNVCLRMLEQRTRDPVAAADSHLEPYPDLLLDGVASPATGPQETLEERERIGLAFVAAMQLLPPKQRVTVVLRDVLDWSAREVAELLERVMRRFQEAWAAVAFDGIVSLLADGALLTMPPEAQRFQGSAQIGSFFATAPLDGRLDRIQLVPTRANGQPALAAYADEAGNAVFNAYGVMVFAIRGERIDGITGFARQPALFTRLGMVYVAPEGLRGKALRPWVEQAAGFARTLRPKRASRGALDLNR